MSFLFENLDVYQRAVNLAERVDLLTKSFPAQGHFHLVNQLRRASLSISLNIAGGNGSGMLRNGRISGGFRAGPCLSVCRYWSFANESN